jgi:hypothetical protein
MTIAYAKPLAGQTYWKVEHAEGPFEWGGRHSIFIEVLDEQGKRLVGIPVTCYWDGGKETRKTEAKPGDGYAIDFPMYAAGAAYGVYIDDGLVSDKVFAMGLEAWKGHMSYKIIYQRSVSKSSVQPPPPPVTQPAVDKYVLTKNGVVVWQN